MLTAALLRMDLKSLPDEVKELVRAQLAAGQFQSVDEVVRGALRLLHEREELFASHREALRAQKREGTSRVRWEIEPTRGARIGHGALHRTRRVGRPG